MNNRTNRTSNNPPTTQPNTDYDYRNGAQTPTYRRPSAPPSPPKPQK